MNRYSDSRKPTLFLYPGVRAGIYGLFVLVLLVLADQLSIHYGLRESQLVLDDFCGAVIAGLLVYRNESARSRYLEEKLKTVELMNHHVRNALQVIVDSAYVHGHNKQLEEIQGSVKRIDWALREILPGRVLDQYEDPGHFENNDKSAA
ncbi:MAG TPA: hypothetical protein VLW06_11535 [Terriglobales bacterium]|nr:hypothetical protein [Terriglobales bacterium]